ncbi:MAG TPA: c-type cytochrome [Pirellulaceae bacterium]|nr:c-type cytochrome [Pirellulaceae bacterium]HMO93118.1 c-type cytochrome [Pirellulaceae bacterium]HMP70323.1 c-type cytochrome [Pirellulaceae bacterium]
MNFSLLTRIWPIFTPLCAGIFFVIGISRADNEFAYQSPEVRNGHIDEGSGPDSAHATPQTEDQFFNPQRTRLGGDEEQAVANLSDEVEGLAFLLNKLYLPRDFHQSTFDELWKDWPEPLRSEAETATPARRTELAYARYGFTPRSDRDSRPLQFAVDDEGYWAMNCFACHGGKVAGQTILGAPNSLIALETLYEDLRKTKSRLELPLNIMDVGSAVVPMGTSRGTTNAVVFGIALMTYRDKHLNLRPLRVPRPNIIHHDMDAPAWWNVKWRERLYIDGFTAKDPRALIPFVMDQRTRGKTLREFEGDFEKIFQFIESLEAPKYPFSIDVSLAEQGQKIFKNNCAECHGDYGENRHYPAVIVPIDKIGTDRVRLDALTPEDRRVYQESWFGRYGELETVIEPIGYQAPPLDGIWASAPYFHNGSVPTLRQVILPPTRPTVWKRSEDGYDQESIGLQIEVFDAIPSTATRPDETREYFDTRRLGKSAAGHDFGAHLGEEEVEALLEYLKTL